MRRFVMTVAALAIPISGAAVVGLSSPAGAGVPSIVCTAISGPALGPVTISGCTGGGGTGTGGSSVPLAAIATGGPVAWVSGNVTTLAAPTVAGTSSKKCPGYVKGAATNPTAFKLSGAVTADTSGLKVPGKVSGAICVSTAGNLSMLKAFKFS